MSAPHPTNDSVLPNSSFSKATIRNVRTVRFWRSMFAACEAEGRCTCGHGACPASVMNNPAARVKSLVWYARRRNHDAIRLRSSRDRWSDDNRNAAINARDALVLQAHAIGAWS